MSWVTDVGVLLLPLFLERPLKQLLHNGNTSVRGTISHVICCFPHAGNIFRMRVFLISCDFLDYSEICTRSNSFWSACGIWVVRMRFLKTACVFFRTWPISRMRKKFTACDKKLFFACGKTRSHANQKSRKIACGKNPIRAENGKTHANEKNGKKRENRMRKKPLHMWKKYQKHMCYKRVRPRHEKPACE